MSPVARQDQTACCTGRSMSLLTSHFSSENVVKKSYNSTAELALSAISPGFMV